MYIFIVSPSPRNLLRKRRHPPLSESRPRVRSFPRGRGAEFSVFHPDALPEPSPLVLLLFAVVCLVPFPCFLFVPLPRRVRRAADAVLLENERLPPVYDTSLLGVVALPPQRWPAEKRWCLPDYAILAETKGVPRAVLCRDVATHTYVFIYTYIYAYICTYI